jgi:uncharacterized protein
MYEKILSHLKDLDSSSINIESSALVSVDGLVIATTLPLDMDADHIGAFCAGVFLLGYHSSEKCASGVLEQVLLKCAKNQIVMMRAGTEVILTVITKPYANLEQILFSLKHAIEKIAMVV